MNLSNRGSLSLVKSCIPSIARNVYENVQGFLKGDACADEFQQISKTTWRYLEYQMNCKPIVTVQLLKILKDKAVSNDELIDNFLYTNEMLNQSCYTSVNQSLKSKADCKAVVVTTEKIVFKKLFNLLTVLEESSPRMTSQVEDCCREINIYAKDVSIILATFRLSASNYEVVFTKLLNLLYNYCIFSFNEIYTCLFSCGADVLLDFNGCEARFAGDADTTSRCDNYSHSSVRKMFLNCANGKVHFLSTIYDSIYFNKQLLPTSNTRYLTPLFWFAHLENLSKSHDKLALIPVLDKFLKENPGLDRSLKNICQQKYTDLTIAERCLRIYPDVNIHKLMTLLGNHSSLYAIDASLPLSNLSLHEGLDILSNSLGEDLHRGSASLSTYQGFFLLQQAFRIVSCGIELDRAVTLWREKRLRTCMDRNALLNHITDRDYEACRDFYTENVACEWPMFRNNLMNVQPVCYQLEIVEDIFSLLFLKHTNLSDDLIVSIDEDENNSGFGSLPLDGRASGSVSDTWSDFKSIEDYDSFRHRAFSRKQSSVDAEGRFRKRQPDSKTVTAHKDTLGENPHLQILATTTTSDLSSGSSICDFSKRGYLINSLVAWDILLVLHKVLTNILDDDATEAYGHDGLLCSAKCDDLQSRLASMRQKVSEGICRLQILSDKFREIGSTEEIKEFMTGTLFLSKMDEISYEDINTNVELVKPSGALPVSRKKGKREVSGNVSRPSESIVNLLLAGPKDLLASTLRRPMLQEAEELVFKYQLSHTIEAKELQIVNKLDDFLSKFDNLELKNTNMITSSEHLITEEIEVSSDWMYNQAILLQSLAKSTSSSEAPISYTEHSNILVDLALTNPFQFQFAEKLINHAIDTYKSFAASDPYSKSGFEHKLNTYWNGLNQLADIGKKAQTSTLDGRTVQFLCDSSESSLRNILLNENNLNPDAATKPLTELISSLCSISNVCQDHQKAELYSRKSEQVCEKLHTEYRSLIRMIQDASLVLAPKCNRRAVRTDREAHMWSFLSYLKLLNYTCTKFSVPSRRSASLHLNVLNQKPMRFLSDILFKDGVDPSKLEPLCSRLKIDLLSVISQTTCHSMPFATSSSEVVSVAQLASVGCVQFEGKFVLNGGEMIGERSIRGEIAGRDILTALLDAVKETLTMDDKSKKFYNVTHENGETLVENKEICGILLSTAEIASVDLTKMVSTDESIVFYINLANLMVLHAGIINVLIFGSGSSGLFAESALERNTSMTLIGYVIGQLGFISLYDILHRIIGLPVIGSFLDKDQIRANNLLKTYMPNCFPDFSIFLVSQAVYYSPKISVYFSDSFEADANVGIASYFDHLIDPQWEKSKDKLFATREILSFLNCKEWSTQIGTLMELVSFDYFQYLHVLRVRTEETLLIGGNSPSRILIDVQEDSTLVDEPSSAIVNVAEAQAPKLINLKEAPKCIQNYVTESSLILHVIMETLCSRENPTVEMLTNRIWSFKTKKFYFEYLSHLLCLPRVSNVSGTFGMSIGSSAICLVPELKLCIEKLEHIFNRNDKQDTLAPLLEAFNLIRCLPSLAFLKYPQLDCIKDLLAVQIMDAESQNDHGQYWNYVYEISNTELMYKSSRRNYKKWPIHPVYHWLCFLLSNSRLKPDQHDWASKKIEQVQCYQKIVECGVLEVACWQDVYVLSRSESLEMVRHLLKGEQYSLVVEWSSMHELTDRIVFFVNQSKLNLYLEGDSPNMGAVRELLQSLETSQFLCTVGVLLYQRQSLSCRKFLIEQLLRRITLCDETDAEEIQLDLFSLRQELIALILIEDAAPSDERAQLISISTKPYLIVEQWLMNLKVSLVEKGLTLIATHLNEVQCPGKDTVSTEAVVEECLCWNHFNLMVEHYAQKAMEIGDLAPVVSDQTAAVESPAKYILPAKPPSREDWQPNNTAYVCCACDTVVFSLFNRRHHCRRCGRVVCYECSSHRAVIAGYGDVPVGICADCHYAIRRPYTGRRCSGGGNSANNDFGWHLSTYADHNASVRRDFTYDHAPSVDLCQSLLNLHRSELRAATQVLALAAEGIASVTTADLVAYPATDTNFVLGMLRTLLSYGKVRFSSAGSNRGVAACEYYLVWIALLRMVDKYNVGGLLPRECLENMRAVGALWADELSGVPKAAEFHARLDRERSYMRRLRDRFAGREMWQLALDVATKTGLETTGVWGAWGMASLKGGDFAKARDCFAKVLRPANGKHQHSGSSSLLNEILAFLQSKPFETTNLDVTNGATMRQAAASAVIGSLNSLSDILAGKLSRCVTQSPEYSYHKQLSPCFRTECEYYLDLYGGHEVNVRFLIVNKDLNLCLKYIYRNDVRPLIFVREVLLTSFKLGEISLLLDGMRSLNQTEWYEKTILFSCHWLEVNRHLNCLLQLQKSVGDYLRGGISLIKMYVEGADSFATIHSRKHYLLEAEELLQQYLRQNGDRKPVLGTGKQPEFVMRLPVWNVHRQMRLIRTQIEAAGFLARIELSHESVRSVVTAIRKHFAHLSQGREVSRKSRPVSSVPTVFRSRERIVLAIAVAVLSADVQGAVDFCYELVEMNSLSAQHLLQFVPATLLLMKREKVCMAMIKGILEWGLVPPSEVKELLLPALLHAATLDDQQAYEQLMKFIPTVDEKVNLYIDMSRYKSAYLAIVQQNSMENMINLLGIAQNKANVLVVNLCTKWIKSHEELREKAVTQSKLEAKLAGKRIKRVNFYDELPKRRKSQTKRPL